MARKTPAKDPETGKFIKDEIISADDAINEERQRIADDATSQFLGEEVKDNKVVTEEPTKEEPKEEVIEKKEETPVDPEKLKKEIAETVSKETIEKISQALTGNAETTKEERNKYQDAADDFFKKNGRNPAWHELIPYMVEDAVSLIEKRQQEKLEAEKAQRQQVEQNNAAREKAFNQYIDEQLSELKSMGRIRNEAEQKALFKAMYDVNQKRTAEGKQPIYSLKEIFYEHYKAPSAQPAGADEPVYIDGGAGNPDNNEEYSYADIKGKSFFDLLRRR